MQNGVSHAWGDPFDEACPIIAFSVGAKWKLSPHEKVVSTDVEQTTIATQTEPNGQIAHVLHFDGGKIIQVDIYEASVNLS